ncbi:glucans biosynthesis glucosyltransferase MdoH [Roseomonas terrae]|jgi:membrane glycosyltransferase|uniref:Glucans biosynthesis glucosyltransferase H n=1 Tax=Neoroseomonas terrae TaxID=424799 RepID=A0ABS5ELE8_9PROT|nr:glucans biosynthesis glucosyltransferase MdoH [Neoroseomonas terrae]MBR0651849.1 glucans biosynthesis glucosyltransferase MdoH [Neoroseomonas terrae]
MDGLTRPPSPLLPPEAPLAMPVRPLAVLPDEIRPKPTSPPGTRRRRAAVLTVTAAVTLGATAEMWEVLGLARWTASGVIMTALFAVLLMPIALSFATSLFGFGMLLRRPPVMPAAAPGATRTALLMPVRHEEVSGVAALIRAMRDDLRAHRADAEFDIFVLSDSTDEAFAEAEREAVLRLRETPGCRVFYRQRTENGGRKAGNIAEWVRRFGAGYESFLILDADSLMSAETLRRLVAAMHADPQAGLLQTVPVLQDGPTLFARLQAFASRVYGPILAAGAAAWHGADGNYWGHNALIRTQAFAETCGLPPLPGRKPFGGDIMSHDFVEAALLRRAGWGVHMLPRLAGSFEGGPPTLPELDARDRRWCQGNLQHAAVIATPAFHPLSRLHLAIGIGSYLSAALWMVFLVLGIAVSLQARFLRPEYFPQTHVLFPQWPVVDAQRAVWVFTATILLLMTPKLLGLLAFALSDDRPREARGWAGFLGWAGAEIVVSALISPATMVRQAGHVVAVLAGRDSGWKAQSRDDASLPFGEAWRFARTGVVLGLLMLAAALAVDPGLAAWMSPVIAGLLLSPLLIWWTAQPLVRQEAR